MSFLEVYHHFEDKIVNDACEQEHPEICLTKTYIADSFLEFVKNNGIDDSYYSRRYAEELIKNSQLSKTDFIYHSILGVQDRMDISEEYLRLYDEASGYLSVLQMKKSQFINELRTIGKNNRSERDKIIIYKRQIEERLNDNERFSNEYLIRKAWRNCTFPRYLGWHSGGFSMDIYSARHIDIDRKNLIFFGDLPIRQAEQLIALKKENPAVYADSFEKMIYRLDIINTLEIIVKNNYYLHNRLPIISAAAALFKQKQYTAFVYLVTPQIEGLFRVLQQSIKGDKTCTGGMKELVEKTYRPEEFFGFIYFAYEFPEWRNRIAHGEMVEVDRELACEVMMALHWIIKEIDSEDQ